MGLRNHLILFIHIIILTSSAVFTLKNNLAEEIDKSGLHDTSSRYSSVVNAASSARDAAAAAAASLYPALNYYTGSSNSYYPNLGPSPYRYNYNGVGSAEPYERTAREYSSQASPANSAGYNDLIPAATDNGGHGHGHAQQSHGHGGGGGGWGWGWGGHGGGGQSNRLSNSGFGLLGLLGLLSLLQSVLNAMTTTTAAPAGRKKRMTSDDQTEGVADSVRRITQLVMPNLNLIAHASNGNIPLECTHRETCMLNGIFLKELGAQGYVIGHQMSGAITNLLKEVDKTGRIHKHIETAGQNGRTGLDCGKMYPICSELYKNGTIAYPPPLLK